MMQTYFAQLEQLLVAKGLLATGNLYDVENTQVVHHLDQALVANFARKRDTDYIVKDGKVVSTTTGWSSGLGLKMRLAWARFS